MTLLETMIGLTIMGILAVAIISGAMNVRSLSEDNVYESSALTITTGFLEQIKNFTLVEIQSVAGASGSIDFFIMGGEETHAIPVNTQSWAELEIPVDVNETGNVTALMPYHARFRLATIEETPGAFQIDLEYRWREPGTGRWRESQITTVRSLVMRRR